MLRFDGKTTGSFSKSSLIILCYVRIAVINLRLRPLEKTLAV